MTSLRMRVVEAGARALLPTMLFDEIDGPYSVRWEKATESERDEARDSFAKAFDAALGYLAETDALVAVQRRGLLSRRRAADIYVDELMAVLREDR